MSIAIRHIATASKTGTAKIAASSTSPFGATTATLVVPPRKIDAAKASGAAATTTASNFKKPLRNPAIIGLVSPLHKTQPRADVVWGVGRYVEAAIGAGFDLEFAFQTHDR